MDICYSNDEYKVFTNYKTFYKIIFQKNSQVLINSFNKFNGFTVTTDFKTISFHASNVVSFSDFISKNCLSDDISYDISLKIIYSLSNQLKYLISNNMCFYKFSLSKILVIDDDKFIYVSNDDLLDMDSGGNLLVMTPFNKDLSPELNSVDYLPVSIYYKTIYWSLADIIIKLFTNVDVLISLKGTPLCSFLERALKINPQERELLYF